MERSGENHIHTSHDRGTCVDGAGREGDGRETKIPATDEDREGFLLTIAMDTSEKVPDPFSYLKRNWMRVISEPEESEDSMGN